MAVWSEKVGLISQRMFGMRQQLATGYHVIVNNSLIADVYGELSSGDSDLHNMSHCSLPQITVTTGKELARETVHVTVYPNSLFSCRIYYKDQV